MLDIKWTGPCFDPSGYAKNSRMFIRALHDAGYNLGVEAVSFEKQRSDLGPTGEICRKLGELHDRPSKFKIINTTPEFYEKFKDPNTINIAYTTFETNKIPDSWVRWINEMDGCITTSEWCLEVFRESGVKVPLVSIPPGINPEEYNLDEEVEFKINISNSVFKFYSIFQWTERKNPFGLLKAYLTEFKGSESVCLILKTYGSDASSQQQDAIKKQILSLKQDMKLEDYPKIAFIGDILSEKQMRDLHLQSDCYVLPHRAEGQGLPLYDAMAYGNPVITTGYSGNMDFTKVPYAFPIKYQLTPVSGMYHIPWYTGDMYWAEPDIKHCKELMRHVYKNQNDSKQVGERGRDYVLSEFNWDLQIEKLGYFLESFGSKLSNTV